MPDVPSKGRSCVSTHSLNRLQNLRSVRIRCGNRLSEDTHHTDQVLSRVPVRNKYAAYQ